MNKTEMMVNLPVPGELVSLIKFWDSWNGRDKTCRAAQYFAKFLVHYFQQQQKLTSATADIERLKLLAQRYGALSKNLSLARKAFRLFRFINFYEKLAKHLLSSPDLSSASSTVKYLANAGQSLFFGIYLGYDAYVWAGKIGFIVDKSVDNKSKTGNYFWFAALVSAVIGDFVQLYAAKRKESSLLKSIDRRLAALEDSSADVQVDETLIQAQKDLSVVQAGFKPLYITLAKDLFDVLIPLSLNEAANWVPNSGQCGLLGTVSSLLGMYQAWPKKAL